jgi:hypothetical protein
MDKLRNIDRSDGYIRASYRNDKFFLFTFWTNILEIIESSRFITPYFLHPIQAFNTYFPTMGAPSFDPERSIGDLAGKVILVTGGWSLSPGFAAILIDSAGMFLGNNGYFNWPNITLQESISLAGQSQGRKRPSSLSKTRSKIQLLTFNMCHSTSHPSNQSDRGQTR